MTVIPSPSRPVRVSADAARRVSADAARPAERPKPDDLRACFPEHLHRHDLTVVGRDAWGLLRLLAEEGARSAASIHALDVRPVGEDGARLRCRLGGIEAGTADDLAARIAGSEAIASARVEHLVLSAAGGSR